MLPLRARGGVVVVICRAFFVAHLFYKGVRSLSFVFTVT